MNNGGYDNIFNLAREHNLKKIMVVKSTWGYGNWCIVNKVAFKPDGKYGFAYGHVNYSDGNKTNGKIPNAGVYKWRVIKVLEEDLEVEYL